MKDLEKQILYLIIFASIVFTIAVLVSPIQLLIIWIIPLYIGIYQQEQKFREY